MAESNGAVHQFVKGMTMKHLKKLLLLLAFAGLVIGCGSDSNGFVATSSANDGVFGPDATGALTFNFARAQGTIEVPQGTSMVRFSDIDRNFEVTQEFSNTMTITNVPVSVTRMLITALDANGDPISNGVASVTVIPNETSTVDLSFTTAPVTRVIKLNPEQATVSINSTQQFLFTVGFSNGDVVREPGTVTYTTVGDVGSIDANGLFTPAATGNGTVIATLDTGETAMANVIVVDPDASTGTGTGTQPTDGTPGGSADGGTTTRPAPDPNGNSGTMDMVGETERLDGSDIIVGDFIAQGRVWKYNDNNATFTATVGANRNSVSIRVNGFNGDGNDGEESWSCDFAAPDGEVLAPGTYNNATRFPFNDPPDPGLSISGDGRGCNTAIGFFTVNSVTFGTDDNDNDIVTQFSASWDHQCGSDLDVRGSTGTVTFSGNTP
jgi:Big-like domain-containing protein